MRKGRPNESVITTPIAAPGTQLDPTYDNVTDPYQRTPIADFSRPPVNLVPRLENGCLQDSQPPHVAADEPRPVEEEVEEPRDERRRRDEDLA